MGAGFWNRIPPGSQCERINGMQERLVKACLLAVAALCIAYGLTTLKTSVVKQAPQPEPVNTPALSP